MDPFPLAAELVDLILYHVDDSKDLRSYRLASQAFCRAASRILYRSIGVTLHHDPTYSERRCKVFNEMFQSKPYIFNYIHSLRVDLSMDIGPWTGELRLVKPDYDTVDPDSIDHQEFTKLLLNMTHASGLEDLVVRRGTEHLTLRHVGVHIMTALVAVRFMPSLRHLQLICLEDPPKALVIGHPGLDGITSLSVKLGTFDFEESEADWKDLGIPTHGLLSTSFREAMVDWDTVLRVHSQLDTFNLKETPPFHAVTRIDLYPIFPLYEYLQEVQRRMGGRQPVFLNGKTLHYRTFSAPLHTVYGEPDWPSLYDARQMVAAECANIRKLVIEISIDLLACSDDRWSTVHFPMAPLSNLREIQFRLLKDHPLHHDSTRWVAEAIVWLKALQRYHRIEKITISWLLTQPWGDTIHEHVYESKRWRELEGLLDTVPALSSATMLLDVMVSVYMVDDEEDVIESEMCVKGLRTVWKHPRCAASVTVPTSYDVAYNQFYS